MRFRIATFEDCADLCTSIGVIHDHEPPWLAQSERWGKVCQFQQKLHHFERYWIASEMANIPAKPEQFAELLAERPVERGSVQTLHNFLPKKKPQPDMLQRSAR